MNLLKTGLLAMVLMCLVTSCQKDEGIETEVANYSIDLNLAQETDWVMADEILVLINDYRASIGLPSIVVDQQYASAYAVDHTQYMIDSGTISHDNFGTRSEALKQRGAKVVGENVAYGYGTAQSVVDAWLNSAGHKKIIEGDFTHSGFGVMKSPTGKYFYTQLFYRK
jgi:uncharacterized protein YkwD